VTELVEHELDVGGTRLSLLRPADPEALIDEGAFAHDEFLPYWAELWPAGVALARALPPSLDGLRVLELGCGLGVPSLVAAARGADVTTTDWAADAIDLLRRNAARNAVSLRATVGDWRDVRGAYDLVLAADVLYERRNVEQLLTALPRLARRALVGLAGRPYEGEFLQAVAARWEVEEVADRVVAMRLRVAR
jgi:predicted nicotinamide N-methyase